MRRDRFSLLLVGFLLVSPVWGERHQEALPDPNAGARGTRPLALQIEQVGGVDEEFVEQVIIELQKIPPRLSAQVIEAGVSVHIVESMSILEPALPEHQWELAGVYDFDAERKRIIINRSRFAMVEGSYVVEKSTLGLNYVIAHEFGHAYDWTPSYTGDGYDPGRIRSNAATFVAALDSDRKLDAAARSTIPDQDLQYKAYLGHFRGETEATTSVPPDPKQETYAEAMAVHLALRLNYRPQRHHLSFRHIFPNVVEYVKREVFPELYPGSAVQEQIGPGSRQQVSGPATASSGVVKPALSNALETESLNLAEAAEFSASLPVSTLMPSIASVHDFSRPPQANLTGEAARIRGTRFEIDVAGLDPATEYRLLASFDGETIGQTDWVVGRDSYTMPTQAGFAPGRYRLTVHAIRRDRSGNTVQTPPVLVNYQPTYLREMRRLAGRDVTAVANRSTTAALRPLAEDVQPRQMQVRFVGLDNWNVLPYDAVADQVDSKTVVVRGRSSFAEGRTYQLRHKKDMVYATLEILRTSPRSAVFLAHNSVAVKLKSAEVSHAKKGGMFTKVMYLPHRAEDPTRANCVVTLTSCCPGDCTDPLAEATRNGEILAILRLGDKNR